MGEAGACSLRFLGGFTAADACGLGELGSGEGLSQQEQRAQLPVPWPLPWTLLELGDPSKGTAFP